MISMNIEALLKETLEQALAKALERHLIKADGRTPSHLAESIRYSLLSPGKRIRPRLMLACSEMLGLDSEKVLPAALSLEMIHCFTLIHDDLPSMDNDDFRRGMPSNHKKYGEGTALLAGDALIALAMDVFLDSSVPNTHLLSGLRRIIWAMGPRGVIGGQAAEEKLNSHSHIQELEQMHAQKTGALFSAALLIPKDFAGIADDSEPGQAISRFAHTLGLSFQAADDLEDSTSESAQDPTSILHYLSADEVRRKTIQELKQASEQLVRIWSDRSTPLQTIAQEMIRKVEATHS